MYAAFTFRPTILITLTLNCSKISKMILKTILPKDRFSSWAISILEQENTQTLSPKKEIILSDYALSFNQRDYHSFDNELNNHGKRLLEICRSADLRILNGRVSGDSSGRATFHERNGTSVVDYAICDENIFPTVARFVVKEPSFFSDHSPVITWLNIETNKNVAPTNDTLKRLPRQFCWENDSTQKFKDVLRSSSTQILIREPVSERKRTNHEC